MLYEKYKPVIIQEIIGNDISILSHIKKITNLAVIKIIKASGFFNLILHGPSGTGKNIFLKCLDYEIKKNNNFLRLYIDGNSESRLSGIREKLHDLKYNALKTSNFSKLVYVKNANLFSSTTQMIFRENMEIDNTGINFIFSTNSIFKINTAIISRCVPLKLKLVSEHCLMIRIIEILNKEDMKPSLEEIILLMKIGNGDVRKTIDLISGRLVGDMIDKKYFSYLSKIYPNHKTPDILFKENRLEVIRKMRVLTEQKNACLFNFGSSVNIIELMI